MLNRDLSSVSHKNITEPYSKEEKKTITFKKNLVSFFQFCIGCFLYEQPLDISGFSLALTDFPLFETYLVYSLKIMAINTIRIIMLHKYIT